MAWSIFSQPNGDLLATAWAVQLLQALGVQNASPGQIQFVYDWEKSEGGGGAYNPLNQGPVPGDPSLTTTGQQYGGGAADYASWQDGIAGAVAFLNMPNYTGVKQAILNDDPSGAAQALWASPWAGSHYGNGANWNNDPFPQADPQELNQIAQTAGLGTVNSTTVTQATSLAESSGQAGGAPSATSTTPPPASDGAALDQWIQVNQPTFSLMLDIPELKPLVEQYISQGETTQLLYAVEQTDWWKTTTSAYKTYLQNAATDPADYSFTTPGSTASTTLANVMNTASGLGVNLTSAQGQTISTDAMKFGWDAQQIQKAIGSDVAYTGSGTDAATVAQKLTAAAAQYYMPLTPAEIQTWAQNIAGGTQTMDQFNAMMAKDASLKWTGMASQIAQGYTPEQITSSLRNNAASLMEVDPSQVNFQSDPFYSKILDYVPPNSPNGVHRMMTQSEMDSYIKSSSQWDTTQQARDSAATLEQQISQSFGKIG